MSKRVFTKEKTLKAEDYHGMFHFENVPAEIQKHSVKSVNLRIPFEESIKLLVALQSAVMSLNKYDRIKEKKTGLLLSIKFDSKTGTIVETDNISDS